MANAYNPDSDDIDVRDNGNAKMECDILDPLPDSPIKDALEEFCRQETGEPRASERRVRSGSPSPSDLLRKLDCDEGVRQVRRQLRRVESVGLPPDISSELLDPLRKQLRKLKKKCREMGEQIEDEGLLDRLEEGIGDLPELDDATDERFDELTGTAAVQPLPDPDTPSAWSRVAAWMNGFLSYLGVAS